MLQLAQVQDQMNQHLQQHIQQGQLNMQAHAGALHQLANSTHQWKYDHIFASIPIYDGSNREEFFSMVRLFGSSMLLLWEGYQNRSFR